MFSRSILLRNITLLPVIPSGRIQLACNVRRYMNDGFRKPSFRDDRHGRYNNRNRNGKYGNRVQRRDTEENEHEILSKSISATLIHVPKKVDAPEVTLEDLHNEGVVHNMLFKSISRMGFPGLTPVQQMTIKPIVESKDQDVIARAKTGTGKTFAFLMPIFQHLLNTRTESQYMVRCVIVAPTRDLALQIESEIKKIHDNNYGLSKFGCISLIGGTNFGQYMKKMHSNRPNIVIATPGRLMATLERYSSKFFRYVDFLVLDEADRLLEIGFKEDLESISSVLNKENSFGPDHIRTLMFSATLDSNVQSLAGNIMHKKECLFLDTVDKNEPEAHEKIQQAMVISDNFAHSVYGALDHIETKLGTDPNYKAILFMPTVKSTQFISYILKKRFFRQLPILEFHGKIDQKKRTNLVKQFKKDKSGILVCTDVGARGMDFANVQEVLQIGVPSELANYIHRIGRTARGGKEGSSTIFLSQDEMPFVDELLHRKNVKISDERNYSPSEKITEELSPLIDPEELSDVIISLISFYRTAMKEYRLKENRVLPSIALSYGTLLGDKDAKIPIYDRDMLQRLGLRNASLTAKIFDIKESAMGGSNSKWSNSNSSRYRNSQSRSRDYINNQDYSYNRDEPFSLDRKKRQSNFNSKKFYENSQGANPHYDE